MLQLEFSTSPGGWWWVGGVTFTKLELISTQLKLKLKFELSLAIIGNQTSLATSPLMIAWSLEVNLLNLLGPPCIQPALDTFYWDISLGDLQ